MPKEVSEHQGKRGKPDAAHDLLDPVMMSRVLDGAEKGRALPV
jgi:hypothetical protein